MVRSTIADRDSNEMLEPAVETVPEGAGAGFI